LVDEVERESFIVTSDWGSGEAEVLTEVCCA
jgi:hypothetical protein